MADAPRRRPVQIVRAEFDQALEEMHVTNRNREIPCYGKPREFVDYDRAPSVEIAEMLCERCPLQALHRELGEVTRPAWGLHGGLAWRDGRAIREEPAVDASAA